MTKHTLEQIVAVPLTQDQLGLLESKLDPELARWAAENGYIRESGLDSRLIRDLAAWHALGKVVLAKGRLLAFNSVLGQGPTVMSVPHPELNGQSPAEMGGTAAGQLAVANLLATWYGLERADFERLPVPENVLQFAVREPETLREAVSIAPKTWGISPFSVREVFVATLFEATDAITQHGPAALHPYMEFPQFPIQP